MLESIRSGNVKHNYILGILECQTQLHVGYSGMKNINHIDNLTQLLPRHKKSSLYKFNT
jgi:hypothetical protein